MLRSLERVAMVLLLLILALPASATVKTLPVPYMNQHKDTTMVCMASIPADASIHPANHAIISSPVCPHCSYYCAPASISMYAQYRHRSGNFILEDYIYDHGKFTQGEIQADGVIQTHGVGMFDAMLSDGVTGGREVQAAFQWAVGMTPFEWGINYGPAFTANLVIENIDANTPILWCDHFGYPAAINPPLPDEVAEINGHAKIIAGYDDNDTPDDYNDDQYWILDPWPGSGPDGSGQYWVAASSVLDLRDLYITDMDVTPTDGTSIGRMKAQFAQ